MCKERAQLGRDWVQLTHQFVHTWLFVRISAAVPDCPVQGHSVDAGLEQTSVWPVGQKLDLLSREFMLYLAQQSNHRNAPCHAMSMAVLLAGNGVQTYDPQ